MNGKSYTRVEHHVQRECNNIRIQMNRTLVEHGQLKKPCYNLLKCTEHMPENNFGIS